MLVDTGVVYAMADQDDAWHARVRAYLEASNEILLVPVTVVPEASYLLSTHLSQAAERRLVDNLARGELKLEPLLAADLKRIGTILDDYEDLDVGFVDASVVAMAERLRLRRILTTDRRHFGAIRPKHCRAFDLVP